MADRTRWLDATSDRSQMTEAEKLAIFGIVKDVGGGIVSVVVERDTMEYPEVGSAVVIKVEHGPAQMVGCHTCHATAADPEGDSRHLPTGWCEVHSSTGSISWRCPDHGPMGHE